MGGVEWCNYKRELYPSGVTEKNSKYFVDNNEQICIAAPTKKRNDHAEVMHLFPIHFALVLLQILLKKLIRSIRN